MEHFKAVAWNIEILNKLSIASAEFLWTAAAEREYGWVKKQMRSLPILALWSAVKTSCLYMDAAERGLGCFMTQLGEDGQTEVVIAFHSIALTYTQRKYHVARLETLGFIWSLGRFHASKSHVPVLARYKLIADEYKFRPIWISGARMATDAFFRLCVIPANKHV